MTDIESLMIDGLFDPDAQMTALKQIAERCDAYAAHLMVADGDRNLLQSTFTCPVDPEKAQLEFEYQSINPRVAAIPMMRPGKATRDRDFITREEIDRDQTYQELIVPIGFGHFSAVPVVNNSDMTAGIALHRPLDAEPFSDTEAALHEKMAMRSLRAFELAAQLERAQGRTLLAQLAGDVIGLVASRSHKVVESAGGLDLLFSTRTLRLLPSNRFAFTRHEDQLALEALTGSLPPRSGRFVCHSACGEVAWVCRVFVIPCFGAVQVSGPLLLTFHPVAAPRPLDRALTAAAFGLTSAETDIAAGLLEGETLDEIASRRGVAITTVRTHLAHLFEKTGTCRQPELVLILSRLASETPPPCPQESD